MSMRLKAILVIMSIVFIVTTANLVSNLSFTRQALHDTMEGNLSLVLDVADSLVSTKIRLLKSNASTAAERFLRADSQEEMREVLRMQLDAFPEFLALTVFDREGIIANYGTPITSAEVLNENRYIDLAYSGERILSSTLYDTDSNDFIMHVFVPVEPGKVLVATISGLTFADLLSGYRLWQTGNIFMLDEKGIVIAHFRENLVLGRHNYIEEAKTNPELQSTSDFLQKALSTERGITTYHFDGVERLAMYKRISGSIAGWTIAVAAPLSESPKSNVQQALLLSFLLFLGLGTIAAFFISGFVVRPYKKIQAQNQSLVELSATVRAQVAEIYEAHERARVLLDVTPLSCRLWNKDFNIFECNNETLKLFKLKSYQEYIDRYQELHPKYQPDGQLSRDKIIAILKKAFAGEKCVFEWMHQLLDGTPLPVEITLVPVVLEGEPVIAAFSRDLREHKQMMRAIEQRDNLLDTGNRAAAVLLAMTDEEGFAVSILKSMELMGRCVDVDRVQIWRNEVFDGALYFVHKYEWLSDIGHQKAPVPIGLKFPYSAKPEWESKFLRGEYINGPFSQLPQSDQELLQAYEIQSIVIIPLFLKGQFWGFLSLDDCHQERTFSEEEIAILRAAGSMMLGALLRNDMTLSIRAATAKLETVIANYPGAIWSLDNHNVITLFDGLLLQTLGLSSELLVGKEFVVALRENQHLDTLANTPESFTLGPQDWTSEIDGNVYRSRTMPVYGDSGAVTGVVGTIDDITERTRLRKELETALQEARKASRAKSNFLASMSHEMRTPLNAIIGLSGLNLEADGLSGEARANLEKVYDAGVLLLNMVNDILDISKIEAGMFMLALVEYDIPSLINDTVTQNILRIGSKPVEFILDINEDLPAHLYGDDLRIKQIFNNLLSNAFKYTREGTVVLSIRCVREGDTVWLTAQIRDTGIGIRPEDFSSLFDDYAKLDIRSNRKIEGTGLGLPIVKKLTEMMGGSVTVESEYGKGSVFTVTLRQGFVTDDVIGPEILNNLKRFHYSDSKRDRNLRLTRISLPYARVLVVDDILTNLDVARGMMKPYGMHIDCVTSGQAAIDAIREEKVRYNAVFMDHMMPGMDGIEATRIIREEIGTEYARTVPIIALTANAIVGNEEMFLSKGFQAFISKPIDMARLDAVIRQWVRDKELEKSLADRQNHPDEPMSSNTRSGRDRRTVSNRRSGIDRRTFGKKIAGLDMNKGIARFGGDEEAYLQVLRSFALNTEPLLEMLEGVNENNLDDYAVTVHGIKGSSRGICADLIAAKAEALEKTAKAGDFDFVSANTPAFLDAVQKLVADIEDLLDKMFAENPKPQKDKPDAMVLAKLLTACENYDMDGVDAAMLELEGFEYESDNELLSWLRENVDQMNFTQIKERLLAAKNTVG